MEFPTLDFCLSSILWRLSSLSRPRRFTSSSLRTNQRWVFWTNQSSLGSSWWIFWTNDSSPGVSPPPLPLEVHAAPFLLIHSSSSGRHLEASKQRLVARYFTWKCLNIWEWRLYSFIRVCVSPTMILIHSSYCFLICTLVRWLLSLSVSALQILTSCCKCKKILMTKLPDKDKWWQWDRIIFCIVYGGSKLWTKQTPS